MFSASVEREVSDLPRKSNKKAGARAGDPPPRGAARAATVVLDPDEEEIEEQTAETAEPAATTAGKAIDPRKIPRAHRLKAEEFEEFLRNYPETQGTMFYCYRLEPKIDRTYTGGDEAESNIDKGPHQKFSLAWLKSTWGSGRYQVRFKDGGKQVCDSVIDVNEYTEFPPILDVRELVDCDANRPFINNLISRNKAFRDAQGFFVPNDPQKQKVDSAGAGVDVTAILDKAFSYADKLNNRGKGNDAKLEEHAGMKTVDLLGGVTEKLIAQMLGSKQGNGDNGLMLALITMLQNAQTSNQQMMLEFFKLQQTGQEKNTGGAGTFNQTLKILETLVTLGVVPPLNKAGAIAGEATEWWERLIEKATPEIAGILKSLITLRAASSPPAQQPAPGANPAPASSAPAAIQAQPRPAAQPNAPAAADNGIPVGAGAIPVKDAVIDTTAVTVEPAAPTQPQQQQTYTADDIERQQIISLGNHTVQCLERGIEGVVLAESIVTLYDLQAYAAIAKHGKEGLLKRLQSVPEIWAPLSILESELEKFIEDFLSYGKNADRAAA